MSIRSSGMLFLALGASLLTACNNTPPDTTPPTVAVSATPTSLTRSGSVAVNVTASDDQGVAKVELYDNGTKVGEDSASPYAFSRSYSAADNGTHTLKARAYDLSGNIADASTTVAVTVDPDEPNDTVTTATPISIGAAVNGTISGVPRDQDYFSFAAKAGDQLHLTVLSQSVFPDSTLDPYVEVLLPDGFNILEKDDDGGKGLESDIRFNITQDGTYYIHLTSFKIHDDPAATDDKSSNTYRLSLTRR